MPCERRHLGFDHGKWHVFVTMVMHPAPSPGTMVVDAMGMVCFIVVPTGLPPAVAAAPDVASVPGAAPASAHDAASVPGVAPAPAVAPVPAVDPMQAPVVPQLPVTMASRIDDGDQNLVRYGNREFYVMLHEGHVEHESFRNTEPSAGSVRRFVAARRRMSKQVFVKESMLYGEYWPRMLLRAKELEHTQGQAAKLKKRMEDQKDKRQAARAKAKAMVKGKAKAKAAA